MSTLLAAPALKGSSFIWVTADSPPESEAVEIGSGDLRERLPVDHQHPDRAPRMIRFAPEGRLEYSHMTGETVRACMMSDP